MPHLIAFCHLRWNFVYQRPQHLLARLAKHFDVVVVEEPLQGGGEPWIECSEVAPGVTVLAPYTSVDAAGFHDDQLRVLKPLIADYLRDNGIDDYIAWFYTPMALPLLTDLSPRAVVFDCMDELSAFKNAPDQLRQREAALMEAADLVLTGGPSLYEARRALHHNVMCLPSAVDARHYSPRLAGTRTEALAQAEQIQGRIPGPRLGFFGVIDERLDIDLVAAVADADPAWQVIMVGPVVKIDPATLPQRANIHWLGQQPYALLPQLVAGWDVCLLPFALNESTRFISPTKTLEYMAAEKEVVSTAVHDVVAMYGDVVRIGHDRASFVDGCRDALSEGMHRRVARVAEMNAIVSRYSWDNTADQIHQAISDVLADASARTVQRRIDRHPASAQRPTTPASACGARAARATLRHASLPAPTSSPTDAHHVHSQE